MSNQSDPIDDGKKETYKAIKLTCKFCGISAANRRLICTFKYDTEDCEHYEQSKNQQNEKD
jgi:hypothetical protein